MKITKFSATNIYGYINLDLRFNETINFLVGGNGCGKTTALNLMHALLTANLKELSNTPYEKIEVEILLSNNKKVSIYSHEDEQWKFINSSEDDEHITFPNMDKNTMVAFGRTAKINEVFEEIILKNYEKPIIKLLRTIQRPVFLGLDRKAEDLSKSFDEHYFERNINASNIKRPMSEQRIIFGSLGRGLMETELLVQNSYKRFREIEDRYSETLKNSLLTHSLQYTEFDPEDFELNKDNIRSKSEMLRTRQIEIKESLSKLGSKDNKLTSELDKLFSKLGNLLDEIANNKNDFSVSVSWLLNKAQIDRIEKIVKIIDENKSKIDKIFKPVNEFLETVNDFFKDSGKRIEIDTVGKIRVRKPNNDHCMIEGLSSGERQILVIFSHVFFNKDRNTRPVFIIDEPELSLHLKWQEMFSEKILSSDNDIQFILATHSPEIVGENKNKSVRCK